MADILSSTGLSVAEIRSAFVSLDIDSSGLLQRHDFFGALSSVGIELDCIQKDALANMFSDLTLGACIKYRDFVEIAISLRSREVENQGYV